MGAGWKDRYFGACDVFVAKGTWEYALQGVCGMVFFPAKADEIKLGCIATGKMLDAVIIYRIFGVYRILNNLFSPFRTIYFSLINYSS